MQSAFAELLVEVEVPRWALLEPQALLFGRVAHEVRRCFEDVLGRLLGVPTLPSSREGVVVAEHALLVSGVCRGLAGRLPRDLPFQRVLLRMLSRGGGFRP